MVTLLAACVGPSTAALAVAVPTFGAHSDFPGGPAILAGFDRAQAGAEWRAGDEVLFGLQLQRDGVSRHWLLHVRLTEPLAIARVGEEVGPGTTWVAPTAWTLRVNGEARTFHSRCCRVLATVLDAEGKVLGRTEPLLPRDFLAGGFARACDALDAIRLGHPRRRIRSSDGDPFAAATVTAIALLGIVQDDPVLAPLLWQVIDKPSVWSVVQNLGARVLVEPGFQDTVVVPSPVPATGAQVHAVPLGLSVNGVEALAAELLVRPSPPPFGLCGGIVAATANHPRHRDRAFSMVLLAARRGPGPTRSAAR